MKKIVLIETKSSHLHVYSDVPIPRIGSVLLGTIMKNKGYEVKVYVEDIQEVDIGEMLEADLVGISALTSTAPRSYRIAKIAREAGIPVVIGGTHVTFEPEEALDYCDYVLRYEAEFTFEQLVHFLEDGGDLSKINGLSYWVDGQKVHNPAGPLPTNLNELPYPEFSMIEGNFTGRVVSVSTARGCPFDCSFCSVTTFNGKNVRAKSVDRVLDEIEYHLNRFKVKYLFFADDIFNYNRKRTKQILQGMIDRDITPLWGAQFRHEAARDNELLELMRASNCDRAYIGFESINQKTLNLFDKKETVQNIKDAITAFHDHKIKIHGMFVVGSDEDTVDTIKDTTKFIKKWNIDTAQLMMLIPIPGSRDYIEYKNGKRELLSNDWSLYDGHHAVHIPKHITPYELQLETMKAMGKFYNLRGIWKRILKFDFFETILRYRGYRLIKNWKKDPVNIAYIEKLRENLYEKVKELVGLELGKKKKAIAIDLSITGHKLEEVVQTFFKGIDVKIVEAKKHIGDFVDSKAFQLENIKPANIVYEFLEDLKGKVDLVILPKFPDFGKVHSKLHEDLENISQSIKTTVHNFPKIIQIPVDIDFKELQEILTKIGLHFTDDLGKIRRAYDLAIAVA
ncbi:MAG: B12-binding domain-containing radical SAM protein [bacterium]